jgi:hypothetical protein
MKPIGCKYMRNCSVSQVLFLVFEKSKITEEFPGLAGSIDLFDAAWLLEADVGFLNPGLAGATQQSVSVQTPAGTWVLYPAQSSYATSVQQSINADGSSNFKSTGKGVIPITQIVRLFDRRSARENNALNKQNQGL